MTSVYNRIQISDRLDVGPNGHIITSAKGELVVDNGSQSVPLSPGANGTVLAANSSEPNGLEWVSPSTFSVNAGNGLLYSSPDTLAVGDSDTILATGNLTQVKSSTVSGQTLISTGNNTQAAVYGAINLANNNAVTGLLPVSKLSGVLPVANGGTGASSFASADSLVVTDGTASSLVTTNVNINDITPTIINGTSVDDIPVVIHKYKTNDDTAYNFNATFLARDINSPFDAASFSVNVTVNNISGVAGIIGSTPISVVYVPLTTTWTVDVTITGNIVNFVVTGALGVKVNWILRINPLLLIQ